MKTQYILVDFENVQPDSIGTLDGTQYKIQFLVGARQRNIEIDVVSALNQSGVPYEILRIEGSGKNALDFHIAFYIGRLSVEHPGSVFHIISKDTGFDPLIAHLKKFKIDCHRWSAITDIPSARAPGKKEGSNVRHVPKAASKSAARAKPKKPDRVNSDRVDEVIVNLEKRVKARPATLKTLTSSIKSHFRAHGMQDPEVDAIIEALKERGKITVDAGKVTYLLD